MVLRMLLKKIQDEENSFQVPRHFKTIINLEGVSKSNKRLFFVYFLKGCANDWLNALPSGTIATWNQLKRAYYFLNRFFPTIRSVVNKQGVLHPDTQDTLLASHKLLSDKIETIPKKLEA
ncbi:hypothetical protein MTR_7g052605 [Medicago truncatula]|uniref:Retrotransposon gag domain-containing protein n=1 Tax=Medicago truncatula TaxID=3880 RepID=A0A072TZB5_MEDTR|nr:hypothetical protein MTR_7g052605 [Medicago truncatula]